tara:strand:+ start:332 stop:535 length:204 start_codon:yes stop_codon:yes gene_type:complete
MTAKQELQAIEGEEIVFNIFSNQVEAGVLSFDDNENAVVTFEDGETMQIEADQVLDTWENWSKENFN